MPTGGRRPGAGRPPTNLDAIIEEIPEQITDRGVIPARQLTVADAIVDTIAGRGFLHDAAARVGVAVETVREWRKLGARINADLYAGKRTLSTLKAHERRCATLATRMAQADSEARMTLLAIADQIASGGLEVTETVTKAVQVNEGEPLITEITTRRSSTLPNAGMITWLLGHRWPADFNRTRVEVSGPDGSAVPIDTTSALERLGAKLDEIDRANTDTAQHAGNTANAGNGHTPTP